MPARRHGPSILGGRILTGVLFISIMTSALVFIQPAPYEGFMALLVFAAAMAGVGLDPLVLPLILLVILFDIGGMVATPSLMKV